MSSWGSELLGTLKNTFQFGTSVIRSVAGAARIEDEAGSLIPFRVGTPVGNDDAITKRFQQLGGAGGGLIANINKPIIFFGGSELHYTTSGSMGADDIHYIRVYITEGATIDNMVTFITSGAQAAREIRLGIYDQPDPAEIDFTIPNGQPDNRLAQTAKVGTGGANESYYQVPLTSQWVCPASGYYWLAMTVEVGQLNFESTINYSPNFIPIFEEQGTNVDLPAVATPVAPTSWAALFVGAIDIG